MKCTLHGFQQIDFLNRDGQSIKGVNLYVSFPEENIMGQAVAKFFIKENIPMPDNIKVGNEIELTFSRKGKVEKVTKA